MKINPDFIVIEPGHETRYAQTCSYWYQPPDGEKRFLFAERTYFPHNIFKPITSAQSFDVALTEEDAKALCSRYPGMEYTRHEYAPDDVDAAFYIYFSSGAGENDAAMAFVQSEDFDRYCLALDKVE